MEQQNIIFVVLVIILFISDLIKAISEEESTLYWTGQIIGYTTVSAISIAFFYYIIV